MWLLLLHLLIQVDRSSGFFAWSGVAQAAESSIGPAYAAEAKILWLDSQTLFNEKNYEDAIPKLVRLLDRYPGYPDAVGYREIRFQLGRAYLELGKPAKAAPFFRSYLEGTAAKKNEETARLLLGDTDLQLKQFHEAYLLSLESEKSPSREIQTRALLLRSAAMIGLHQNERARATTDSAIQMANPLHSPELNALADTLNLEIKAQTCAELPGKAPLDEALVRTGLESRGMCLQEAMVVFRRAIQGPNVVASDRALALMIQAFNDYHAACNNPPNPPRLTPKDRTALELKRYRIELVDSLKVLCGERKKAALAMTLNWKQEKNSEAVQLRLQKLEESLK